MATGTSVKIPASTHTVSVSVIDGVKSFEGAPLGAFAGPPIDGFDKFNVVAYSFLITHKDDTSGTTTKIIFDLGVPKDWQVHLPPTDAGRVQSWVDNGAKIDVPQNVAEKLIEGGTDLNSIEAMIWSHPHWDHMGRPAVFPSSVTLLCGPGMITTFGRGYPENERAPYRTSEIEGRDFEEVTFDGDLIIGDFEAIDFFKDGSFYLLNAPGHCIAHINALARVSSNPDTFILMSADSYHHGAQLRPSKEVPMPKSADFGDGPISTERFRKLHPSERFTSTSAGSQYDQFTATSDFSTTPFFTVQQQANGATIAHDLTAARDTIRKLQTFDADERVLLVPAHDYSLRDVVEYYPANTLDDWKQKGWKEKSRWLFLRDLDRILNSS